MASRLQEYLMANPMYGMGANVSKSGTSTEPVRSPIEGIARALQGGIGGLMQGYAMSEAKDAQKKDTASALAYLTNKDPTKEAEVLAGIGSHPDITTLVAQRELAKEKIAATLADHAARADERRYRDDQNNQFKIMLKGMGGRDPEAAADAAIRRQIAIDTNRQDLKDKAAAADADRRFGAMQRAFGGSSDTPAPPAATSPVIPQGADDTMLAPGLPIPDDARLEGQQVAVDPMTGSPPRQQGKPDSTQFDRSKVNMDGRTWRGGMPVLNELWAARKAAEVAKNPDLLLKYHNDAVMEAKGHFENERKAKDFRPIRNSYGVETGQVNSADGREIFLRGGNAEGTALPPTAIKGLVAQGKSASEQEQLAASADNGTGGYLFKYYGDAMNFLKRNVPELVGGDKDNRAQWWQRYHAMANVDRHELFGASLTGNEIAAWERATVNTGMDPVQIKMNLSRQAALAKLAASRTGHAMAIEGNNPAAIEAALGYKLKDLPSPFSTWDDKEGRIVSRSAPTQGAEPAAGAPGAAPQQAPQAAPSPTASGVRKYNPATGRLE